MEAKLVADLERFVSQPRLGRYRTNGAPELDTIVLYCWNIQLAESLMPAMAIFEVALRNAVHETLTAHTGTDLWFSALLHPEAYANIQKLTNRLTTAQGAPTSGKVISETTFGFWQKIFSHRYSSLWWGVQTPRLLPQILPNHPNVARDARKHFESRLEYFVRLRNRAVHHESIIDGISPPNRPRLPLDAVYKQLIETLEWIDGDAAELTRCLSRFEKVHDALGRSDLERTIRTRYQVA